MMFLVLDSSEQDKHVSLEGQCYLIMSLIDKDNEVINRPANPLEQFDFDRLGRHTTGQADPDIDYPGECPAQRNGMIYGNSCQDIN